MEVSSFHRSKRERGILRFFGLSVLFVISTLCLLVGIDSTGVPSEFRVTNGVLALVGACLFVIFLRGAWMATGRTTVHVFSINHERIEWGFVGREKQVALAEVAEINWDEMDCFQLTITMKGGEIHQLWEIAKVVSPKSRGQLLVFLEQPELELPIGGFFDPETEKGAAAIQSTKRDGNLSRR